MNLVLAKFVAELFDVQIAHAPDCGEASALGPSSSPRRRVLYEFGLTLTSQGCRFGRFMQEQSANVAQCVADT
jgi:hypothetical protein